MYKIQQVIKIFARLAADDAFKNLRYFRQWMVCHGQCRVWSKSVPQLFDKFGEVTPFLLWLAPLYLTHVCLPIDIHATKQWVFIHYMCHLFRKTLPGLRR